MHLPTPDWSRQCLLNAPAGPDAPQQGSRLYANLSGPLGKRLSLSLKRNYYIPACIVVLLRSCCPFAIVRFVSFGIVNALKGVAFWPRSHGGKEALKTIGPPLANSDAATAIAGIAGINRVVASLNHGAPRDVFRAVCSGMAMLIRWAKRRCWVFAAAARLGVSSPHIASHCNSFFPAIALAFPKCIPTTVATFDCDKSQFFKSLTGYGDWGRLSFRHKQWLFRCFCLASAVLHKRRFALSGCDNSPPYVNNL